MLAEGGLTPRFLPREHGLGEPDLEARLDAATARWFWSHVRPGEATVAMPHGWGVALAAAGLADVRSRSFLVDVPPPLGADERSLVADALTDAASRAGEWLTDDDRAAVAALVDPARPDGVHQRPDVFILTARTFHVGTPRLRSRGGGSASRLLGQMAVVSPVLVSPVVAPVVSPVVSPVVGAQSVSAGGTSRFTR